MDQQALFEQVRQMWPDIILFRPTDPEDVMNVRLFAIYEAIEDRVGHQDEWLNLALWAFHQSLGNLASIRLRKGQKIIAPMDVPFSDFDHWMRSNLKDKSWAAMRAEYDPDLS